MANVVFLFALACALVGLSACASRVPEIGQEKEKPMQLFSIPVPTDRLPNVTENDLLLYYQETGIFLQVWHIGTPWGGPWMVYVKPDGLFAATKVLATKEQVMAELKTALPKDIFKEVNKRKLGNDDVRYPIKDNSVFRKEWKDGRALLMSQAK